MPEMPARVLPPGTFAVKQAAGYSTENARKVFLSPSLTFFLAVLCLTAQEIAVITGKETKYISRLANVSDVEVFGGELTDFIPGIFEPQTAHHKRHHAAIENLCVRDRAGPLL